MISFENGKIVTDLSDHSFIEQVLQKWGKMSKENAEIYVHDMEAQELSEERLRNHGLLLVNGNNCEDDDCVELLKTGHHEWEIKDCDPEDNEEFVKKYF